MRELPARRTPPEPGQRRVGIFTDDFFPASGGVGRSIQMQIDELVRRGDHVTLLAPHAEFQPPERGDYVTLPILPGARSLSFLCSLRFDEAVTRKVVDECTFDVVHSQNERGAMALAARVAGAQGIPHVHTFHSNYAGTHATWPKASALSSVLFLPAVPHILARVSGRTPEVWTRRPAHGVTAEDSILAPTDWRNLARIAAYFDAVTSPAQFVIDSITEASGGALTDRSFVIPSGVAEAFAQAERRRPRQETVRFVSCGRLAAEKRVDRIVRAMAELGRDDAELVVIGDGPELRSLQGLARTVEHGHVRFLGHIPSLTRLAQEIADADVFVLASYHFDTQGMVLAEAASAGAGILYCDDRLTVGVTPENSLLTGETAASLARGMRALMGDRDRLGRMAAASRRLAPELTTQAMGERYSAVYDRVIAERS